MFSSGFLKKNWSLQIVHINVWAEYSTFLPLLEEGGDKLAGSLFTIAMDDDDQWMEEDAVGSFAHFVTNTIENYYWRS